MTWRLSTKISTLLPPRDWTTTPPRPTQTSKSRMTRLLRASKSLATRSLLASEVTSCIIESRDKVLEAQTLRDASPPFSALPNSVNKLRKRSADWNIRATSASHRRKPSWHGSIASAKTLKDKVVNKSKGFFISEATKTGHHRRTSEGVLSVERPSFQNGTGHRLSSIEEQNVADTVSQDE